MQSKYQNKRRRFENKSLMLVKQHLSSDMRTIKKHSITSNTKLIQKYQTNIGILYQQTNLRTFPGKFWEPENHTTRVINDISYVKLAIALHGDDNMLNKISEVMKQVQAQKQIHASQL